MRDVNPDILTCTTLCWVWRITLSDDSQYGFTDHDRALEFEGLICAPHSGLSEVSAQSGLGFAVGQAEFRGALNSELFTQANIDSGYLDGVKIESFRVNWATTSQFTVMETGMLGGIKSQGGAFTAQWLGPAAQLERSSGRVFGHMCDAQFGDGRCGLNVASFPEGTVCPRTFEACQDQFSNSLNFRGFPYLLGDDVLLAGPQEGEVRNGGSRYS